MKYECATLWHKMPDNNYKRIFFNKVLITKERGMDLGGSQIDENNLVKARIFTSIKFDILPDDLFCDGYEECLTPPPNAYIIKSVKENFSTSTNLKHYKISCV